MRQDDFVATKKYIEIQYDELTQERLRQYCIDNNFDLSVRFNGQTQPIQAFDFHTTVWFTANAATITNGMKPVEIDDVVPAGFALFGPEENILVMEIDSDRIRSIRQTFGEHYQLEDEWPDYRPHITLSYAYKGKSLPQVDLPDFEITGDQLHVKNQKKQ